MLSNLYLHWFDKVFHRQSGPAQWAKAKLVRYADDFVVLARYQGRELKEWIEAKIEGWLGLEINRDKTRVVELSQAGAELNFLGYLFRYDRDRMGGEHRYLNVTISKKALGREKGAATRENQPQGVFQAVAPTYRRTEPASQRLGELLQLRLSA